MKPLVVIACICIILIFAWFATCTYTLGKAFTSVDEAVSETDDGYKREAFSCETAIDTLIDRIEHDTTFGNPKPIMVDSNSENSIAIQFRRLNKKFLQIVLRPSKFMCVNDGDLIYLIFTDGSNMKFANYFNDNCDREVGMMFENYKASKKLAEIRTKTIQAIRVVHDGDNCEADLTINSKIHFSKTLECILN